MSDGSLGAIDALPGQILGHAPLSVVSSWRKMGKGRCKVFFSLLLLFLSIPVMCDLETRIMVMDVGMRFGRLEGGLIDWLVQMDGLGWTGLLDPARGSVEYHVYIREQFS